MSLVAEAEKAGAEPALVRCPSCDGLRSITPRNQDSQALCRDCRRGRVVPVAAFHGYWLERFSPAEIHVMARRIWG